MKPTPLTSRYPVRGDEAVTEASAGIGRTAFQDNVYDGDEYQDTNTIQECILKTVDQ
jgi:ATP-dependent exoDNAse (exonuclease V) beta subunit